MERQNSPNMTQPELNVEIPGVVVVSMHCFSGIVKVKKQNKNAFIIESLNKNARPLNTIIKCFNHLSVYL